MATLQQVGHKTVAMETLVA